MEDLDFRNNGVSDPQGGNEIVVYFRGGSGTGPEKLSDCPGRNHPHSRTRTCSLLLCPAPPYHIQAVENLVKKNMPNKSPLLRKLPPQAAQYLWHCAAKWGCCCGDVLGHKDVNTTRKHYAAMDDARRRSAASAVPGRTHLPF